MNSSLQKNGLPSKKNVKVFVSMRNDYLFPKGGPFCLLELGFLLFFTIMQLQQ